ncbi:GGDEF domain-containing protein [Ideonella sp. 4Y16]|uniref:diguanylate cyclase n=1 Tax=Ideonella alba TaxID=2824118 RepID=A0A940YKE9_9BURK|nr:diguanylate cyclase [Ideonella alba]MBQ0931454.1 GGDEF domain-containing protein [Ideonella alba]MBQ0943759.1 GGDEF domain-containing protein [Ideonella alba]
MTRWRVLRRALPLAAALVAAGAWASLDSATLLRWEQRAWADPEQVVADLQQALEGLPAERPEWLEGQRVLAEAYLWRGDMRATDQVITRIDAAAAAASDPGLLRDAGALSTCLRAARQRKTGTLGRADALLQQAAPALAASPTPGLRHSCAHLHALVLQGQGRYDEAARTLQVAIRDADQSGATWRRSELRTTLSDVLWRVGQRDAARTMQEQALQLARQHGDQLAQSHALTVQAMQLGDQGRSEDELQAMEQALALARDAEATSDEAHCLANLSDYHLRHDQAAKALAVAERALPMARRTRNTVAEGLAQVNAGLALIALQRKEEGVRRVRASIESDLRADDIVSAADSLVELGLYLERAGHLADAYDALREHRQLADEVARRTRQTQLLELQEAFEADRRRDERARLIADNQLKEAQWRGRELSDRFWLLMTGAAGVLATLAALVYHRLRSTQTLRAGAPARARLDSAIDPLTGLGNRRLMPPLNEPATGLLCLIDLDHFKSINDRFGAAAGDQVLVEVARRLRAATREPDLVLRWGGEEFLVLAPPGPDTDPEGLVTRLLGVLAGVPMTVGGESITVTASMGFLRLPLSGGGPVLDGARAITLADAMLRRARQGGRNRACGLLGAPPGVFREGVPDLEALDEACERGLLTLLHLTGPWKAAA